MHGRKGEGRLEGSHIVDLYWARDDRASAATQEKYGTQCQRLAENLLDSPEDGEECVNEALYRLWSTIPPQRPESLWAYLQRTVRNLAIDRWRRRQARKRGEGLAALSLELEECCPAALTAPSAEREAEAREITDCLSRWLGGLNREDRILFLRRYWYGDRLEDLAARRGVSANRLAQKMYRLRGSLRKALEKEGIVL